MNGNETTDSFEELIQEVMVIAGHDDDFGARRAVIAAHQKKALLNSSKLLRPTDALEALRNYMAEFSKQELGTCLAPEIPKSLWYMFGIEHDLHQTEYRQDRKKVARTARELIAVLEADPETLQDGLGGRQSDPGLQSYTYALKRIFEDILYGSRPGEDSSLREKATYEIDRDTGLLTSKFGYFVELLTNEFADGKKYGRGQIRSAVERAIKIDDELIEYTTRRLRIP